jgi:hypothetical protein
MINKRVMIAALAFVAGMVGCSKDEDVKIADNTQSSVAVNDDSKLNARYYAPWVYVMDARFSRGTCSTGPGVCFKDGNGNTWNYGDLIGYAFVDNSTDGDVGPIGMHLDRDKIHLAFFRSLEEDTFIIDEDVRLSDKLAGALGGTTIILKAGVYKVSYDTYKYGEAVVDFRSR